MTDQPALSLTAHIEERILAPLRRNPRATRWFVLTVASIVFVHAGLLALLLYRDKAAVDVVARQEPTPVEIVVEPPPTPPKPPPKTPEPPKPQAKQAIEKPASSAPRAPNEDKVDTTAAQKDTHAPKAPAPAQDGKPDPAKEASSPSTEPAEPTKENETAAAKPDVLQKDAEALDKAVPKTVEKPRKVAKLPPRAKTRRAVTAAQQLAGASMLPDYSFAKPTKKAPVSGGTEDSRYLAIVYGMIMQHRSLIAIPGTTGGSATITFTVDDEGNVIGLGLQHSSGYPAIDAEAAEAIRRASPFPPPPAGAPHGLIATIDFGDSEPSYAMSTRGR